MKVFISSIAVFASLGVSVVGQDVTGSTGVNCNGFNISLVRIDAASQIALQHLNDGTQVGPSGSMYPRQFSNSEGFVFNPGCNAPYFQFPVLASGLYTGGDPGFDRVIIGSWDGTNARFCDAITYRGAPGNNFLQCTNT